MKKLTLLAALAAIIMVGFNGCKGDDDPTPASPTMSGLTVTGDLTQYAATLTFSEGVYAASDKTGNLTNASFSASVSGGTATLTSYTVTHTAGQATATINLTLSENPSGNESFSVKPASATSIYNGTGQAMATTQMSEVSLTSNTVIIKDDGNGTGTATWTADHTYILDGLVFVNNGQTLTIEPGTVIKGMPGQGEEASALIVARGGKIMAEGTAEKPIIFTAESDDLAGSVPDLDAGLWGGVIMLGKARLNTVPAQQQIEGIDQTEPRGVYGGDDDADNSGVLRYISIRHGGTDIGEGNEINGLTLGGVGSGTVIEYIEVFANKDDGIEFFGGTPRLKHIVTAFCGDDSYDYDQGYRGYGQFWLAVQGFDKGDRIGEHDGGTDPETGQPYAIPTIFNVTYVGQGPDAGKRLVTFRDNAGGNYANSIFYNQAKGVDIELLVGECSYTRFNAGELTLKNNLFYNIAASDIFTVAAADDVPVGDVETASVAVAAYFAEAGNTVTDPGFNVTADMFNVVPTNDVTGNMAQYPVDWFETVSYKGAIDPNNNWLAGWTLFSKYMGN